MIKLVHYRCIAGALSASDGLRGGRFSALRVAGDASTDRRRRRMRTLCVASEMALSVLAYNLTRVMNIVGTRALLAAIRA